MGRQGLYGRPAGRQIVDAGRGKQFGVDSENRRRRQVVGHQIPREDVSCRHTQFDGQEFGEALLGRPTQAPKGRQVLLLVELEAPFVDLSVEMDRQLGDPEKRAIDEQKAGI